MPASGLPRLIRQPPNAQTQGEDFPQLIPAPPGSQAGRRKQIVSGFLVASASFADGGRPSSTWAPAAQHWKRGWAVTVVSQPTVNRPRNLPHVTGQSASETATSRSPARNWRRSTPGGQYQIPHGLATGSR